MLLVVYKVWLRILKRRFNNILMCWRGLFRRLVLFVLLVWFVIGRWLNIIFLILVKRLRMIFGKLWRFGVKWKPEWPVLIGWRSFWRLKRWILFLWWDRRSVPEIKSEKSHTGYAFKLRTKCNCGHLSLIPILI